jgi:antitoxin HigA-1
MIMKGPPHPGFLVRHACLDALALSVSDAAVILGVSRQALSNVVNGRANISADMAIRLEKAFGSTADTWLRMQMAYDLAQARSRAKSIKVRRHRPLAASA